MGLPKEYLAKMRLNPDCLVSLHLNDIKPDIPAVEYIGTLTKLTYEKLLSLINSI